MSTLLLKSLSMKFRDYIDRTHVFTSSQVAVSCGLSGPSIKTMLRRAIDAGQIERVRRGLYVSKLGRFALTGVDSFEVVSAIDTAAVLSFHSALEAHGVAHNMGSVCQFRSVSVKGAFEYSGISYAPFPFVDGLPTQALRGRGGLRVLTTTREQTIVDCLAYPDRCGGIEEVLMSVSLFPYIDAGALKELVCARSSSLAARIGWLLEQKANAWRVSADMLEAFEQMARGGPFRLDKDSVKSRGWSRRWKLCLPNEEEEIKGWLL